MLATKTYEVRSGVIDLIGAARPSIADPFLPRKIEEGRIEDIRECIGCNICVTADFLAVPLRCTQNPTMGEEWRKGWHPEKIPAKTADESVLVVGGGPSGLEAARALGQRGYHVTLVEAEKSFGGRVLTESQLPGLSEWKRVADYRTYQISQMANVQTFLNSSLSVEHVLEFNADHVVLATGSKWRSDGVGRSHPRAIPCAEMAKVLSPDDISADAKVTGPVAIFDDDHYYMGGLMAEKLRLDGHDVTYVTTAADVSHWTHNTLEQERIQTRLLELGIEILPQHNLSAIGEKVLELACVFTGRTRRIPCRSLVQVTMRDPVDSLHDSVAAAITSGASGAPKTITRIGDCLAPGTIAAAVYSGHRYARELGEPAVAGVPFRRELPELASD